MDWAKSLPFVAHLILIGMDHCFEIHDDQPFHIGDLIPDSCLPFLLGLTRFSVCANIPSIRLHSCSRRDFFPLISAPNNVAAKRSSTPRRKQHHLLVEFRQVVHPHGSLHAFFHHFWNCYLQIGYDDQNCSLKKKDVNILNVKTRKRNSRLTSLRNRTFIKISGPNLVWRMSAIIMTKLEVTSVTWLFVRPVTIVVLETHSTGGSISGPKRKECNKTFDKRLVKKNINNYHSAELCLEWSVQSTRQPRLSVYLVLPSTFCFIARLDAYGISLAKTKF